jgi:hypothetical protein
MPVTWRGPLPPDDPIFHRGIIFLFKNGPALKPEGQHKKAPEYPERETEDEEH